MELSAIGYSLVSAILFITFIFTLARYKNRFDLIDPAWGLVFISIAATSYLGQDKIEFVSVQTLVFALVIIWGIRLFYHLYSRWTHKKEEDHRYAELRRNYSKSRLGLMVNMYIKVYLFQAVLAIIIMLPVVSAMVVTPQNLSILTFVGGVIWLIGFLFEAIGDGQLAAFTRTSSKKGKLMTEGLWKYTRHPNYFGEVTQWWGIFIIVAGFLPNWWIAIIGPLTITIVIVFFTGVPMTEKHFEGRSGWAAYKRRTSKFLPLPPKKG